MAKDVSMGTLRQSMEEYLATRRRLGFKLHEAGLRLKDFVSFMEERRARRITSALTLTWAQRPRGVQPVIWSQRLGVVRDFARYLSAFEPRTEVPADGLLPHRYRRVAISATP
jgi:integrase/recombinase XerD